MALSSHISVRTCLGCRQRYPQKDLVRIVRLPEGKVAVDFHSDRIFDSKRLPGRGIYLCKKIECLKRVLPGRRKSPAAYFLKASIPDGFFDRLKKLYEGFSEES